MKVTASRLPPTLWIACIRMVPRSSTWWRALAAVLLSLVTAAWPSAARAATTPSFTLVHQDPVAALTAAGTAHVGLSVRLAHTDAHAEIQLSLYPRLITRGGLAPLLNGSSPGTTSVSTTGNLKITCDTAKVVRLSVTLFTHSPAGARGPCVSHAARLRLPCAGAACDGVYPLSYSVTNAGVATTEWSMVAVRVARVATPLHLDLIYSLDPSSLAHPTRTRHTLTALSRHPGATLSLTADYRTLDAIATMPARRQAPWRTALSRSLTSPLHRAVVAPPGDVDFAGLAAAGLKGQVAGQLSLASSLLRTLTGRYVDAPVVVSGHPSASALAALGAAGASEVVVPESLLATPPSTTLTWGAPFRVAGAPRVTALASDQGLSELATNASIEPDRRAVLTIDTLAFLHYEAPDAPAVRTVVIVAPAAGVGPAYVNDLLDALAGDPYVTLSSLLPSFDSALIGTNGAPASRALGPATPSPWSSQNVDSMRYLALEDSSFAQAIPSATEAATLRAALARAEVVGAPGPRQDAIDAASALLARQLDRFSVDAGAVTLTGPGTPLPVTVYSREPYTVNVVVHLITDRLSFPRGSNIPVSLDAPVKSLRVATAKHNGSSLTLQVVVTTPNGQVTLARAALQVRIAGASLVGYLLTGASLAVLAWWWWRTARRSSKGRHAR